jgi:hypothetical protein
LLPLVQAEEEEQASHGGKETPETHERLRTAARELGRRFVEEMRRMEAEVSGQGADASLPPRPVRLRVIPPRVFIEPEGTAVLTVQSWPEAFGEDPPPEPWVASLRVDDEMVATLPEGEVSLELDPRDPSRRRGAFEVHAGAGEDVTMVDIRLGTASEVAVIEVAAASEEPPVAPNRLMFANGSCRVPPNRPKRLILMAPPELVGKAGPLARLTVTHEAVTIPAQARLEYRQADDGRSWYEAEIEVSMPAGLTARLRASLGGQIASCALASAGAAGRVPFQFLLSDDDPPRYDAQGRAEWIHPHGVPTLKIFTRHRSLRPAFGERMEHQEELTCRLLIAEVLASEIALHTIRESRAQLAGSSREAAELFGSRFKEQQTRYLRVAYGVLAPELTELPAGSR